VLSSVAAPTSTDASLAVGVQAAPADNRTVGSLYGIGGSTVVLPSSLSTLGSVTDRATSRISGPTRYDTAAAVSRTGFPSGASTLFVATGENFPDGLAAGATAGTLHAPVLLTSQNALPAATATEIRRLLPTSVRVVGGPAVVSDVVVTQIRSAVPAATVSRVAGPDRYATAALLADLLPAQHQTAYVATGADFPDALSAGPAAAHGSAPLLLTSATSLPAATRDRLSRLRPAVTFIAGGTSVVSSTVAAQIASVTGGRVVRAAGANRYETAAALSSVFSGLAPVVLLATGRDFPDALSAGALAGTKGGPLLLDAELSSPPRATVDAAKRLSWWTPATGKVIRYIPVVHPNDEMSARSVLAPQDAHRYDVYVLLTRGETTSYCTGMPVSNPWVDQEYLPQPQPTGVQLSDRCKKHRLDSWATFLAADRAAAGDVGSYTRRTGQQVTFDGRTLPTPVHLDADGVEQPADYFDVAVGPTSARVVFDLGLVNRDEVIWALENVRMLRSTLFPTQLEGDVVGAGYYNATSVGTPDTHPDHKALHDVLGTTDLHLPGGQYDAVGHTESGRAFGASVADYCAMMCHPGGPSGLNSGMGDFQYSYGWLAGGKWRAGALDVDSGFSQYQSFAKWF
jgi:putative cell wall-binding protein